MISTFAIADEEGVEATLEEVRGVIIFAALELVIEEEELAELMASWNS